LLVNFLCCAFLLFLFIFGFYGLVGLLVFFGLFDMESDFAHAVIVAYFFCSGLDDDVVFVDGGVDNVFVVDGEDGMVVGHGSECEYWGVFEDSAVIDTFV